MVNGAVPPRTLVLPSMLKAADLMIRAQEWEEVVARTEERMAGISKES